MKALRKFLDKQARHFHKGGKLEKLYPLWEAQDTLLYSPSKVTRGASHVRDAADLKRIMTVVIVALFPCIYMAMYNTGLQAHRAIQAGAAPLGTWQTRLFQALGGSFDPDSWFACILHGAIYFIPLVVFTYAIGGIVEVLFAVIRKHEINEGFFVTGMLIPLTLPPTIPYWQVALATVFGVFLGKEIFGGTGMNILNPALTTRAFLFFAYPAEISGDKVWIAADFSSAPDGYSGATLLSDVVASGQTALTEGMSWWDAFLGTIPGSMGETSALACLLGAVLLLLTRVASWRIMTSLAVGTMLTTLLLNWVGSDTNLVMEVPFWWHMVLGGWAFGAVFMATDPVTGAHSNTGKLIYGFSIGVLAILVRVLNPAYPEGMMLAILFMNVFAATIDYYVVQANIRRRRARYEAV